MYTNRLDNIFDNFFSDKLFSNSCNNRNHNQPEVNIYQDEKGYSLELKTPGLSNEDLEITIDENKLNVSSSISKGGFKRVFELPEGADQSNISAELKDGIATVNIPLIPKPEPRKIKVVSA